ncbi:uncharacterized protein LOC130813654 [Amaranthus tricolor]|uniref:uncharacterized protein LOC130813654 n=1 Tax=Amaranthus tricolor TaxID=29722 RepID=UPI00258E38C3|nr:uncharacterized protein LOC130813654 [Amaranthus tricolor]
MRNSRDKISKPSDPTMNPSSPYFLHHTDTRLKLVSTIFSGVGFKSWKRAISIGLSGKNKMGFMDGTIKRLTTSSAYGRAWDKVNNVVLGWLLNAVDERIYQSVLWFKTTKEVWDNLEQRFGQSSSAQLVTVYEAINKAAQTPNMSIEEFFTKMKSLWDEVDAVDPVAVCSWTGCTCELSQKTLKSQQGRRLIQFLMKLDAKYQHSRSNILMMKEMPTIMKVIESLLKNKSSRNQ